MNIISNSCLGSYISRDCLKSPYNNPFCWSVIDDNSICNLIKNYQKIDFNKYELTKDKNWNFYITIDKQVKVWYVHYRFSKTDNTIRKDDVDVFYNKIWEYIIDCYEKRIKRMTETPIFVLGSSWGGGALTKNSIKSISQIQTNYKIIMTSNVDIDFKLPNNCKYFKHNLFQDNVTLSNQIYENYIK